MPWFSPLYQEQLSLNSDGTVNAPTNSGWGFNFDQKAVQQFLY